MQKWINTMFFLIFAMTGMVFPSFAQEAPGMVVGRVYQVEGDLLRYVPAENDWVAVVRDAPFGTEDTLYSGNGAMAELLVPNGSWIRVGNNTQLQFIDLERDLTETDVASGIARFYNKGSRTVIKATSPHGYVLADPGSAFDFYVGENSVEVVAIQGEVSFVHAATGRRYDISAGSASILADRNQVSSGEGTVDPDWDQWNENRENFWNEKSMVRGRSEEYLPPDLRNEAYALEENGRWERVPYEGSPRWFWRPTTVTAGWSPFTVGRWTDWYGDQTWIPAEPFGYVTHHYGNWVNISNNWYWTPPVARVQIGLPLLNIGFYWNPGRVSWIYNGGYVGWVPLAPRETYYSRRHWGGPRVVVVNNINITRININIGNYAYARHAVVVNQNNFYRVNNYRTVRVTNINNTTIINNYRSAPVVNNRVITNYETNKQRYNYTNRQVTRKPHTSVQNRIRQNQTIIRQDRGRRETAAVLQQRVKRAPEGRINREALVAPPRITNRIVPVQEVNRPESEVRFQQKDIRKRGTGAAETRPGQIRRAPQPVRPEQVRPERVQPTRPAQQQQPVKTEGLPVGVTPQKPAQPAMPGQIRRSPQPVRPDQVRPERLQPTGPAQQQQPVKTEWPERVAPQKPAQPAVSGQNRRSPQPVRPEQVRPERLQPTGPAQQRQPGKIERPERVTPQKSIQPATPAQIRRSPQPVRPEQVKPERVQPTGPAQQRLPVKTEGPVQVAPQKSIQPATPAQIRRSPQPERLEQVRPERVQPSNPAQKVAPLKVKPAKPGKRELTKEELEIQRTEEKLEKQKIEEEFEKQKNRR